jgi:hypothetical protein
MLISSKQILGKKKLIYIAAKGIFILCAILNMADTGKRKVTHMCRISEVVKMAEKQFQYEIQPYQEDCVGSIIDIFKALQQNQPFNSVMTVHHTRHNYSFPVQDTKNIDIMMETGTGKTFTFIKTMFET